MRQVGIEVFILANYKVLVYTYVTCTNCQLEDKVEQQLGVRSVIYSRLSCRSCYLAHLLLLHYQGAYARQPNSMVLC